MRVGFSNNHGKSLVDSSATSSILLQDYSHHGCVSCGIGVVLTQVQDGAEVPIAFASQSLNERERRMDVNAKEAYAVLWAFEYFEKYLLGHSTTLRTDHKALTKILSKTTSTRKSQKFERWLERLSRFDYVVEYIKGEQNVQLIFCLAWLLDLKTEKPSLLKMIFRIRR